MHIVRREKQSLLEQFDELFHILWRALSADEG
jgi:TetR/AcrR family transcriptional regulator, repressor of fatR-cypB operon